MSGNAHTQEQLAELQAMPLLAKELLTKARIEEWCNGFFGYAPEECTCVSFSGGKDSTVLLHQVRKYFPNVRAVFSDTGLEYPEIRSFAKTFDNVEIVRPKMRFDEVISTYGYPLISKEVAEAIYYARRIRSQTGKLERERRQQPPDPDQHKQKPPYCADGPDARFYTHTRTTRRMRTELCGKCGAEQFGEKILFNKEKYLPIAVDLPVLISHYCCQVMKKAPMSAYQRKNHFYPFIGSLAKESLRRKQAWLRHGCNAFESKKKTSQPMSFWLEQDVLAYIVKYGLDICSVYGDIVAVDESGNEYDPTGLLIPGCKLKCTGCDRTGCMFCAFGLHNEKGITRFQRMAFTHPKQYEYAIGGGQWVDNPAYDPVAPEYDGEWKNWNPKKILVPSKKGLGMGKVFDMVNELYGKDFYRYE